MPTEGDLTRITESGECKLRARLARFLLGNGIDPLSHFLATVSCTSLLVCVACSSSLPSPSPARQPRAEFLPVPYPPPAAFAEVVPPRPRADALWVDGHWAFRGGTYVWQRGGWVVAPEGARFAHWRVRYSRDGTLLFAEEVWYDARLKPIQSPKKVVDAYTPPNELTRESQHGF